MASTRAVRQQAHYDFLLSQLRQGDDIEVFWPADDAYYPGRVANVLPCGSHQIIYFDGDVECLDMSKQKWRFVGESAIRVFLCLEDKD